LAFSVYAANNIHCSFLYLQQKMAVVFKVGEVVQLVGILSNQLLNGATGMIAGNADFESRGRYDVHLQSPAAAVAAHPTDISLSSKFLIRMVDCARPDCKQKGINACSACQK
jgi:hypothetical protein